MIEDITLYNNYLITSDEETYKIYFSKDILNQIVKSKSMHKLFWADFILSLMTILGSTYLYIENKITLTIAVMVILVYILSKVIAYLILPYEKFDVFINFLITNSKLLFFSGFEIFKTFLVLLLFIGFVFISPFLGILESILVILMRLWGRTYFLSLK